MMKRDRILYKRYTSGATPIFCVSGFAGWLRREDNHRLEAASDVAGFVCRLGLNTDSPTDGPLQRKISPARLGGATLTVIYEFLHGQPSGDPAYTICDDDHISRLVAAYESDPRWRRLW